MKNPLRTEPALISGAVIAFLNCLVLLNALTLTVVQVTGVNTALAAFLALFVRQSVRPTVKDS